MNGTTKTLVILSVLVAAIIAAVLIWRSGQQAAGQGYKGQGGNGLWDSLFNNGANIIDSSGRMMAAVPTSIGNAISSIVATAKTGRGDYAQYGYSEQKVNYGPYILVGAVVVTAGFVAAVSLSKK